MNNIDQETIRSVVENVLSQLNGGATTAPAPSNTAPAAESNTDCACHGHKSEYTGKNGVFQTVEEAANAAQEAFIKFQQLLRSHIGKERKVKFFADQMNITPRQLNVITQSTIHLSAKDFIISTLILEAKKYLRCSDLSSKEIAYQLGFDEPTNFTKFFKKHTGLLPSEFTQSS